MIKIEHVVLPSAEQMDFVIEGMRNPKNSWDRSDSFTTLIEDGDTLETADYEYFVGKKDLKLMNDLSAAGPVHRKYMRMMPVMVRITAPLYWWKEADTYKVGTVCNSCSTMFKIAEKEFSLDDFSHEHLEEENIDDYLLPMIMFLNQQRSNYINEDNKKIKKGYWWQMIQLLPTSYNQTRNLMLNYEVLANIYKWRKDHKLDEWRTFCKWIETLPYSELITGKETA